MKCCAAIAKQGERYETEPKTETHYYRILLFRIVNHSTAGLCRQFLQRSIMEAVSFRALGWSEPMVRRMDPEWMFQRLDRSLERAKR